MKEEMRTCEVCKRSFKSPNDMMPTTILVNGRRKTVWVHYTKECMTIYGRYMAIWDKQDRLRQIQGVAQG